MNTVNHITAAALGTALLAFQGCMWSRVKVNDPEIVERSHAIVEGKTSEKDLEHLLMAKPAMRIPGKESHTLAYTFSDTKHHGLMLILFNFTRSTTVAETLYVEIDHKTETVKKVHRPYIKPLEWRFWPFGDR